MIVLLCESFGEIPGDHHSDVVLIAFYPAHLFHIFGLEVIGEVMHQQHTYPEADGIDLIRLQPAEHLIYQLCAVLFEALWTQLIAGSPVVNEGQKAVCFGGCPAVVLQFGYYKCVELVLVVIVMGQFGYERLCPAL